jgi:hypothetical protein
MRFPYKSVVGKYLGRRSHEEVGWLRYGSQESCESMDCTQLVQNTKWRWSFVNTLMNPRVPWKFANLLTNGVTITFSRRALLYYFWSNSSMVQPSRAMAQSIIRRPLTAESRVHARIKPCGISGFQSGTETRFSLISSGFSCQYHPTVSSQTRIFSWWPQFRDKVSPRWL